ncbi:MAG TPA: tetratricopeptide repeat protein, partial [Tepidisphaeraceae bacterium]|nr:tetratricopeptide repeat protein [Tepidisphaeraceae bacterium]
GGFETGKEPKVTAETHFAAGQFAESQENIGQAITQYQAAVKLKPDHAGALYRLGVLYTRTKQWPAAEEAWKGYIKATGDSASGYSDLGFTYQLSGDDGGAEGAYKMGIARDAKNRPCRVNYGLMLAREGKFDSAIAQWQTVLTPGEVHYNLGSVYEQRGDKAQARMEYKKALEAEPGLGDAKARLAGLGKE